eukprot:4118205-Prymnesium_polylepis.1
MTISPSPFFAAALPPSASIGAASSTISPPGGAAGGGIVGWRGAGGGISCRALPAALSSWSLSCRSGGCRNNKLMQSKEHNCSQRLRSAVVKVAVLGGFCA